jgi:hypothetical protein
MRLACFLAAFAAASPALAADNQKLSITLYNSGQALVEDVRTLDIAAGRSRIELKDVSNLIEPQTVSLAAPDTAIVEQNFDFDLLTPSKLMEKAVGKQVQIVRTNPGSGQQTTETATVLSANQGVVLKIGERIEVLRDDGVPTRVIFDGVPENLRARPTLSVTVDSTRAGRREAALSYLTGGLQWRADYVAVFNEAQGKLDFQGWITLINQTSTTFENARADLVAGDLKIQGAPDFRQPPNQAVRLGLNAVTQAGTETGQGPRVGDYYVYPLKERTTIAANQQKQVGFIEAAGVAARKVYQYEAQGFASVDGPIHVDSVLQFSNSKASGLAAQLPAGAVRIYMHDADNALKFIGESAIGHTPQGSDLSLKTGDAFDVTIQPTVVSEQALDKRRTRYEMAYVLHNAKAVPVTVQVRQDALGGESKVLSESLPSHRVDASRLQWDVPVPANGETRLAVKVERSR